MNINIIGTLPRAQDIKTLYGEGHKATDFALLTGVLSDGHGKGLVLSLSYSKGWIYAVSSDGVGCFVHARIRRAGAMLCLSSERGGALPHSVAAQMGKTFYYPQDAVSDEFSKVLERAYLGDDPALEATNRKYTYNSTKPYGLSEDITLQEYEYGGKTYVRVQGEPFMRPHNMRLFDFDTDSILEDRRKVEEGKTYWVEVGPVKFWRDGPCSEKILWRQQFSEEPSYDGNFPKTLAYRFTNETVLPEMQQVLDREQYPPRDSDTERTAAIAAAHKKDGHLAAQPTSPPVDMETPLANAHHADPRTLAVS